MGARVHVIIRGMRFISISAAARHFGVHRCTICHALDRGTLDTVGMGANWATKQRVCLDDTWYDSLSACAAAIGAGATAIRNAVKRIKARNLPYVDFKYGRLRIA